MGTWILIVGLSVILAASFAFLVGRNREITKANEMKTRLCDCVAPVANKTVNFKSFALLPAPVKRYFRLVLTDGQKVIDRATIQQTGMLRTGIKSKNWFNFNAMHLARPTATGFFWNAKVNMPMASHMRVLDSYVSSAASGRVSLLSAIPVATETDTLELNSGALHRYLAEAVWYPTALLPGSGVSWTEIDDRTALASLSVKQTTVSLEFRFNEADEVTGIYTPQRFGRFGNSYKQIPWEGHFRNYEEHDGMRIPAYGEVGWYVSSEWKAVWKGNLTDLRYDYVA